MCIDIETIENAINDGDIETAVLAAGWIVDSFPECNVFFDLIAGLNLDTTVRESVCKFACDELDYYLSSSPAVY